MNNKEAKKFAASLGGFMPELDLHGLYRQEALEKLELFIYENFQKKENRIRVIYGFGTGKLCESVLEYLGKHPLVDEVVEDSGSCIVMF